jgi:hypothetical protein
MIRTTTKMICCLLFQASLPASYCAETLHTATHLLNHLPMKAASHPTHYFALYDTTPSYDHLRVFGCAYYPNTSATAPHKLSPRSNRSLILSYSPYHKGYRCLDLTSHRIIISHHVIFDEDVFPLAGSSPPTNLDSLFESDQSTHSSQAPRLAPLPTPHAASPPSRSASSTPHMPHVASTPPLTCLPAPRSASSTPPAPHAAMSTPSVPRAAPSTLLVPRATPMTLASLTSGTRFADPALVYHHCGSAPPSVPMDPGPSTSAVRFTDPAVVYHRLEPATHATPGPSVYHLTAIHRDPGTSTRW